MTDITGFKKDYDGSYIQKDPGAELTYTIDWTNWVSDSDSLSTASFAVSTISGDSAPVVVEASGVVVGTDKAYVTLSGGSDKETYTVTNTITTTNGDTDVRRFKLQVLNRFA